MNQSEIGRRAVISLMAMISLAEMCHADSPLPPPERKTIWSANKRFFAVMEPDKQITTVFRTTPAQPAEKVWSMYGWFRVAALTDDGEHLVTGYDGMDLVPLDYDKQQVMLYFFKRGELLNHVTLDQIIRDKSRLRRTVSHYAWGRFVGLDESGRYVIETVEGRRIGFDAATGKPEALESSLRPPGKRTPPRP